MFLCKMIYAGILRTNSKILEKLLVRLRSFILKFYNPIITLTYRHFTLSMPFSHTIFMCQKHFSNYDMHLHKIAKAVMEGGGDLKMIDVGANIGDTIVFTNISSGKYLLIEGEKLYNQLIEKNLYQNNIPKENFIIENVFIGDSNKYFCNKLYDGSGLLTEVKDHKDAITTVSLDSIVYKHNFKPNFLKIDTDGFDFKVIRSAKQTLRQYTPVLFFEWDIFFLENQNEDPLSIFPTLKELGYIDIIVFDNFGNLLCKEQIDNICNLKRLLNYTKISNKNIYYYDLLVTHHNHKQVDFEKYFV